MPLTDPNTIQNAAANQPLQAARLDADRDAIVYLGTTHPHCRVYNSANISINNNTLTALTFNSERLDVGGMHSTSSNTGRITIPASEGGFYHLEGHIEYAANGTGIRIVQIRLNGTTVIASESHLAVASNHQMTISTLYQLAAADYVELLVYQGSGGALNALATGNYSPEFAARWCAT